MVLHISVTMPCGLSGGLIIARSGNLGNDIGSRPIKRSVGDIELFTGFPEVLIDDIPIKVFTFTVGEYKLALRPFASIPF